MRLGQEVQALPRRTGLSLKGRSLLTFSGLTRAGAERALGDAMREKGLDDPLREARLLLRASEGAAAAAWLAEPDAPMAAPERARVFATRRLAGEPLSRILGRREFWGLDFTLSAAVLDPRADTVTLVEAALRAFAGRKGEALRVLDFGIGSGAILAALLSELPSATGLGVDISPDATAEAAANLARLGLGARAAVVVSDWGAALGASGFDIIVANPPYIPSSQIATLAPEVKDHDPRLALDGGADGLDAYRALGPETARRLAPGGRFFFEIGAGQGPSVRAILKSCGLAPAPGICDLAGVERVIGGERAEGGEGDERGQ